MKEGERDSEGVTEGGRERGRGTGEREEAGGGGEGEREREEEGEQYQQTIRRGSVKCLCL